MSCFRAARKMPSIVPWRCLYSQGENWKSWNVDYNSTSPQRPSSTLRPQQNLLFSLDKYHIRGALILPRFLNTGPGNAQLVTVPFSNILKFTTFFPPWKASESVQLSSNDVKRADFLIVINSNVNSYPQNKALALEKWRHENIKGPGNLQGGLGWKWIFLNLKHPCPFLK